MANAVKHGVVDAEDPNNHYHPRTADGFTDHFGEDVVAVLDNSDLIAE